MDDILGRIKTLEDNQAGLSPVVSGIAEGIGALGRSVAAQAQEQIDIGHAINCSVHELGAIAIRNYFALPVTMENNTDVPTAVWQVIFLTFFLSVIFKHSIYPALHLIVPPS